MVLCSLLIMQLDCSDAHDEHGAGGVWTDVFCNNPIPREAKKISILFGPVTAAAVQLQVPMHILFSLKLCVDSESGLKMAVIWPLCAPPGQS